MMIEKMKNFFFRYSNTFDDKRSALLLKQLMPLVNDERDKQEV